MSIRPWLIAAAAVGLIPAGWFVVYQLTAAHPLVADLDGLLGLSLLIYCYSAAISFVCGYVTLALLRRFAIVRWWTASLAGLGWSVLMFYMLGNRSLKSLPLLSWSAMGVMCGLAFWAVWSNLIIHKRQRNA